MTVKNFRVSIGLDTNSAGVPGVTWALVYVPYGTSINSLTTSTGSLYEPSSHVINSGVWDLMLTTSCVQFNGTHTSSW